MTARITIPPQVQALLRQLNAAGFSAYAVGGCVRDSLLGCAPQDWDICTSAAPEQTEACFAADRTILTGARYGTVTVVRGGVPYEITTFRAEAGYADSRHPDRVDFLRELAPDLARRDFTVNAMAADAAGAVTDLFGGQDDLRRGVIRCVGDPAARFSEDALRMLRALRFAARLSFRIDGETAAAIHAARTRLRAVAPERLHKELSGILCGRQAAALLEEFSDVLFELIPELAPVRASGSIIRIIRAMSGHTRWPLWTAFRPRSRSGWRHCCTMPESQRHFSSIKISSAISAATRPPGPPSRRRSCAACAMTGRRRNSSRSSSRCTAGLFRMTCAACGACWPASVRRSAAH